MTLEEYNIVKGLSYNDYLIYLKNKYGSVPYRYGNKKNHKIGLFIHHDKEYEVPSLSHSDMRKEYSEYQVPEFLTYCDYLEHLLLHIMIGRETNPELNLGLNGPCKYILPAIINYYKDHIMNPKLDVEYYTTLDRNKDVFDLLLAEYNELVKSIDVVMDKNKTLYLQAENLLDTVGRALIVLGTGLGKTTTALQYIKSHQVKALVIGPNNLIKEGWNKYAGWVDTITYAGFAHKYITINFKQYGLVILDEVHHAGFNAELGLGAKVWGQAIQHLIDNNIKVLGLTATPDRTDGIMLGETLFKDCTCIGRTLEDAIDNNDIHPFSYITSIYDTDGITEELKSLGWHNKTGDPEFAKLEGQIDLVLNRLPSVKKIFEDNMPKNKRKGIIFIQDIEEADKAMAIFLDAFPNAEFRKLHSSMSKQEIKDNRKWFEDTDEGYLIAVNMISEGAHYKGVNTIIMFRKTESYVLFSQQIGRIVTLVKDEDPKAIVFDLVNNINTIKYNDRVKSQNKPRLDKEIRKALKRSKAAKSEQIIVKDYAQDICERLYALKEYCDNSWEEWEISILKSNYASIGPIGCLQQINAFWDSKYDKAVNKYRTYTAILSRAKILGLKFEAAYWSEGDIKILYENYSKLNGAEICAKLLNKPKSSIQKMAARCKLQQGRVWTTETIEILKQYYPIEGKYCYKRIHGATQAATQAQAHLLGLHAPITIWTEEEDLLIKQYYPTEGTAALNRLPGRTMEQLVNHVRHLGIKKIITGRTAKVVLCVETGEIFKSIKEAATKYKTSGIYNAIINNGTSAGYHWKYIED